MLDRYTDPVPESAEIQIVDFTACYIFLLFRSHWLLAWLVTKPSPASSTVWLAQEFEKPGFECLYSHHHTVHGYRRAAEFCIEFNDWSSFILRLHV